MPSITSIQYSILSSRQSNGQEKELKGIHIRKEEKLSLFTDDMILCA